MESSQKDIILHTQITEKLRENKETAEAKEKIQTEQTPPVKPRPRLPAFVNPH